MSQQTDSSIIRVRATPNVLWWLIVMAASTLVTVAWWRYDKSVVEEHHVIESAQALLLLAGCAIHGLRARAVPGTFESLFRMGLALLCLSLATREVDIDRLGAPPLWPIIEYVVRSVVVGLWVALGVLLAHRQEQHAQLWRNSLRAALSPTGLYTASGALLYGVSFFFDKQMLPLSPLVMVLCEETIQLNGALLFCAGAATARATVALRE